MDYLLALSWSRTEIPKNQTESSAKKLFTGWLLIASYSAVWMEFLLDVVLIYRVLLQDQVLIQTEGLDCNVIKMKPPLVFSLSDADRLLLALDTAFKELTV